MSRNGHQEFHPRKSVGKSRGKKVEIQDIRYFGYHQGFKVWINGVKYPKAKGGWYTTNNQQTAINQAFEEAGFVWDDIKEHKLEQMSGYGRR